MPVCSVPGCTSGYKTNPGKFHFFTVPVGMVEEWKTAIKSDKLISGRSVCQRHFLPDEVDWRRSYHAGDGTFLGEVCSWW